MKYIAHRGNLEGAISGQENSPHYIDAAIYKGFDVEIDLRKDWYGFGLGHDKIQYRTDLNWLLKRKNNLWIHCKDLDSLVYLKLLKDDSPELFNFNYFFHNIDQATMTSTGQIWLHNTISDPAVQRNSIVVLPEEHSLSHYQFFKENPNLIRSRVFWDGICSDYINKYKEVFEKVW